MQQALNSTRPGGNVGFVGVPHGVALDGTQLFYSHVGVRGGPAPVRQYLPDLIDRVMSGRIKPGKVFDLELPLSQVAEGYKAMDERRCVDSRRSCGGRGSLMAGRGCDWGSCYN
ncbi:hypothetical protein ADL25_42475 [Streptomyces sp. NRRL F-5122]|nr:hypothetical protein ADL25_42475 [Streptomyces sp. NRRL F-5122]